MNPLRSIRPGSGAERVALALRGGHARTCSISRATGMSVSSVVYALGVLRAGGHAEVGPFVGQHRLTFRGQGAIGDIEFARRCANV